MSAPLVVAAGLRRVIGAQVVLAGLDLALAAGECVVIVGGNGAGKTSFLELVLGFAAPSEGSLRVLGLDPAADGAAVRERVGYVPERVALYDSLTPLETLAFFRAAAGMPKASAAALADDLRLAGLEDAAHARRIGPFSKGMQQKVAIAVALQRAAPLVLLDEPTGGLDPRAADELAATLAGLRERGRALLVTTHDLGFAGRIADRVLMLERGEQRAIWTREALRALPLAERYLGAARALA